MCLKMQKKTETKTKTSITNPQRAGDVDLLRCFGIVLMIMGHIGFGGTFDKYIHAFHMPLWFVISGYFFNEKKNTYEHIIKKIRTLLIPYLFFSVCYEILWTLKGHEQWYGIVWPNTIQVPLNGALWFLPAMFMVDIVSFLFLKYIPLKFNFIIFPMIAIMGSFHLISLPFSADSALVGIGFFFIGYLIKRYGEKLLNLDTCYVLMLFILNIFGIFYNEYVNVRSNQYGNILLFWINAVVAVITFWNICRLIDRRSDTPFLCEIGSKSLIYVCLNQFLLFCIGKLHISLGVSPLLWKIICLLIVLDVCFIANRIIERTKLKFILGK